MEIFNKQTNIDFIGSRRLPIILSAVLIVGTFITLFTRGLDLGLDFTGGTLVEMSYRDSVDISEVRKALSDSELTDTIVQHFGTTREVLVRLPVSEDSDGAVISNRVVEILREAKGERFLKSLPNQSQLCQRGDDTASAPCRIQVRRIEFVGPQIGDELVEKGGSALIFTIIAILIYVMFRFQWRFAVGSVVAIAHDVLLTFGFFSVTGVEFDLSVLAAILAVLGYSLNDTIVVFDRIRENFSALRKTDVVQIMNVSINQTLSRTIITSGTTLLVLIALFLLGGEIIHGFAIALIVGVVVGTYSSIYIATPVVLALDLSHEDMMPPKKDDRPVDDLP
jgi:preprotein translocase subunit SecF